MPAIRILATEAAPENASNVRGRLFEKLVTTIIKQYGATTSGAPSRNYAGMELDIEAVTHLGATPIYAECKCHAQPIDAPSYHAFFGKFTAWRSKHERGQGLFVAIPGVNKQVWGFHKESVEASGIPIEIIEQERVAELIVAANLVVPEATVVAAVEARHGTPGDRLLLCTERGTFWAQYIIRSGASTPSAALLVDRRGKQIKDGAFLELLSRACPELDGFEWVMDEPRSTVEPTGEAAPELVVQVKASSSYFEYQFPASPEYFVGRQDALCRFDGFVRDVLRRRTSARSLLVHASSGWGKSSFVLSAAQRLRAAGHYAVAVDSRSASSGQFVLQLISELPAMGGLDALLSDGEGGLPVSGFDGALERLTEIDAALREEGRLLVVFLDQFENIFFLPHVLEAVHRFFGKVVESSSNIVIAFAWKTDLVGVMDDFPYSRRDAIRSVSHVIDLPPFGEEEVALVLDKLRSEMRVASLREDLRFFLSEYSQGYPWLLMRLCAHVRVQRELGIKQSEIAMSVLNVEELFHEDMHGLSPQEEVVLRAIAKAAPIAVSDLGEEEFDATVVQRLLNRRLVVRIGSKYDIYWDIFRDFLNTGRLPIQENYILRSSIGSVLSRFRVLIEKGGALAVDDLRAEVGLSRRSLYNVIRDMRVLGLVEVSEGTIRARFASEVSALEESARLFLKERLPRNRIVKGVLASLSERGRLSIGECAELLSELAAYISAKDATWRNYAAVLVAWLDFADLAVLDRSASAIRPLTVGSEVRERTIPPLRPSSALARRMPFALRVQYGPVEAALEKIVEAAAARRAPEWDDFRRSTATKALSVLDDLGFLSRQGDSLILEPLALDFFHADAEGRRRIVAPRALSDRAFGEFVEILNDESSGLSSNSELGKELSRRLGLEWGEGTAEIQAKILLDWARQTGLAPPRYAAARRGPRRVGQRELPLATEG